MNNESFEGQLRRVDLGTHPVTILSDGSGRPLGLSQHLMKVLVAAHVGPGGGNERTAAAVVHVGDSGGVSCQSCGVRGSLVAGEGNGGCQHTRTLRLCVRCDEEGGEEGGGAEEGAAFGERYGDEEAAYRDGGRSDPWDDTLEEAARRIRWHIRTRGVGLVTGAFDPESATWSFPSLSRQYERSNYASFGTRWVSVESGTSEMVTTTAARSALIQRKRLGGIRRRVGSLRTLSSQLQIPTHSHICPVPPS